MTTWITENIGVITGAVNIGLIRHNGIYLVDTGIDNTAINKVIKQLNEPVGGAIITHHHADHMGGLNKLESLGITQLYGPEKEIELITNPLIEPYSMFGGSFPPKKLRNRHLEAKPCKSIKPLHALTFGEIVNCPGHTIDHSAFLKDKILFSGDAAFTQETIEKYQLLFVIDPLTAIHSLETLKQIDFEVMVPGHGPILESKKDAIDVLNSTLQHFKDIIEQAKAVIGKSLDLELFVPKMINSLELNNIIENRGIIQYYLYQVSIQGCLQALMDEGFVDLQFEQGKAKIIES
ncbi:MAG: MBL fold metallo-hydrolase [Candidatus Heimdallarchaeota archaeon]|nr:MBL fold metallo-hydrolase [Candidatus Heimdallarchaeota archaeon]